VGGGQQLGDLIARAVANRPAGAEPLQIPAEQNGLSFDAIDSKDEVEDRSDERRKPDEANPEGGRTRVALVEESVPRSE